MNLLESFRFLRVKHETRILVPTSSSFATGNSLRQRSGLLHLVFRNGFLESLGNIEKKMNIIENKILRDRKEYSIPFRIRTSPIRNGKLFSKLLPIIFLLTKNSVCINLSYVFNKSLFFYEPKRLLIGAVIFSTFRVIDSSK